MTDKSSRKTAERANFFPLTLQMAFASVTDHNVIKWLPSVSLYVRSTIGNSVKNFSCVIYVSIQNQKTMEQHFLCMKMCWKKKVSAVLRIGIISCLTFSRTHSLEHHSETAWVPTTASPLLAVPPPANYLPF